MTVDQLQWYAGALPDTTPTRKGELVALLARVLGDNGLIRVLLSQLTPVQQQVLAKVDAYGDLRFEGQPQPVLAALDQEGWVIRVGTFSKIPKLPYTLFRIVLR